MKTIKISCITFFSLMSLSTHTVSLPFKSVLVGTLTGGALGGIAHLACQQDSPLPLILGSVTGLTACSLFYSYYHPENRLHRLEQNYKELEDNSLVKFFVNTYDSGTDQVHIDVQQVIRYLRSIYVDFRNPLDSAVQAIATLKAKAYALEQEAIDLRSDKQSRTTAAELVDKSHIIYAILHYVLVALKDTPEYTKALEIQVAFNQADTQAALLFEAQMANILRHSRN